jgi:N-acetylneuraminic acid mutarotase
VVLAIVVAAVVVPRLLQGATPTPTTPAATAIPRWQARTAMRAARTRLATVTYENLVYAIGGETDAGVSDQNERYDPERDTWASLAPKPVAVADIGAAVVGGLIYVTGGRVASGGVTDVVEAYDPVRDEWATRAPLPVALSGYALAAFEGRLYVFGGWNGTDFVANVFEYEPASDTWIERTRMPTARGFAAAARAGDKLYVIGGTDAQGASRAVEAYVPARDSEVANPWETLPDAPAGQHLTAAASIADALYVAGRDEDSGGFAAWEFRPEGEAWQPLELGSGFAADWLGMVAVRTHIFVFGAPQIPGAAVQLMAYQALYTNLIPVITSGEGEP